MKHNSHGHAAGPAEHLALFQQVIVLYNTMLQEFIAEGVQSGYSRSTLGAAAMFAGRTLLAMDIRERLPELTASEITSMLETQYQEHSHRTRAFDGLWVEPGVLDDWMTPYSEETALRNRQRRPGGPLKP